MKTKDYQVFISFKNTDASGKPTPDAAAARMVYEALRAADVRAFFSEESLAETGKGEYNRSIAEALDSAQILVLIGSCPDYIKSPWVRTEWNSFLEEIRADRKPRGELFIINCGTLRPGSLPLFLRSHQICKADRVELERLVRLIRSKLPQPVTLGDRIRLSLHCRNPKKNEDKVYLVTAHNPNGTGVNVTAHWGARATKRLASQLKAIDLQSEPEVRSLVEKLEKQKTSSGYRTVPFAKLLTREARAFLEATLGLSVRPKVVAVPEGTGNAEVRSRTESKQPRSKRPQKNSTKRGINRSRSRTERK